MRHGHQETNVPISYVNKNRDSELREIVIPLGEDIRRNPNVPKVTET